MWHNPGNGLAILPLVRAATGYAPGDGIGTQRPADPSKGCDDPPWSRAVAQDQAHQTLFGSSDHVFPQPPDVTAVLQHDHTYVVLTGLADGEFHALRCGCLPESVPAVQESGCGALSDNPNLCPGVHAAVLDGSDIGGNPDHTM